MNHFSFKGQIVSIPEINCYMKKITGSVHRFMLLLTVFCCLQAGAQNSPPAAISGKIVNTSGEALPGAVIETKTSGHHAVADVNGLFKLAVSAANETIVVSHVGYQSQEVPLKNRTAVNIILSSDAKTLTDVVVIGYGTQKRANVTGAVGSMKAENLDERPVTRVDQALVGQIAGVQVKQTSGVPGKGFSIQVRGTGSITAGNEPLYVIDGFPLSTATQNSAGGFSTGNPLDNINPNDIESIEVLKDASAGAIYGSRAANGVVLITTKKGKVGKPKISFNTYGGYNEASRQLKMLDGAGWIDRATEIINAQWVASGAGRTASQTTAERRQILALAPGTINPGLMIDDRWLLPNHPGLRFHNWQDETFRKGLIQNYQLSGSGGNEYVKYYVSGNYIGQEGMVKGMDYTAFSGRANVEVNASKKFKFGLNIAPTYTIANDPGVEGKDNILHQLTSFTPVQEDTMGLYPNAYKNGQYPWSVTTNSPVAKLESVIGETKTFRTLSTLYLEYQPLQGLVLRSTANLDNTDNRSNSYTPYTVQATQLSRITQPNVNTAGVFASFRKQTFVNENTISYNKVINDVHDISLLAGASYSVDRIDNVRVASSGGYSSSSITTLNFASSVTGNTTGTRDVLLSYFGRVQYSLQSKYMVSASIRNDGSSRFGQNTRWGTFPSASVGWRVSEENFMKHIDKISDLKFRASWGQSGNYNIGDYSSIPQLGSYNYTFNTVQVFGQAPAGITNPDLKWEKSETYNVGIDLGLLNNRITASVDVYNKLSKDLLLNVPIAQVTGFATALTNVGKVRNKGWEVELTTRNMVGAFQWTTAVNFSHNTNKVIALGQGAASIQIPSLFDVPHSILQVVQPIYSIYVVRQIGILSQEDITKKVALYGSQNVGDPKYFDANGDGKIDANDRVIAGHPTPDYTWGFTNTFRYKGFDLTVLVQGQWGGSIYSLFGRAIDRTGQGASDNAPAYYTERWRSPSDPGAGIKGKAYSTFGRIVNTDWLYPSDYWRLRNVTVGYDLGRLFRSKFVQGARCYVTMENFFGHDKYKGGYNPEATNTDLSGNSSFPEPGDYGGLPLPRSLIIGLNVNF